MRAAIAAALLVTLCGCATAADPGAPGCQGARRPANPHGSVLAPAATAPQAALQAPQAALCRSARA